MSWQAALLPITVILDAAPNEFAEALPVDPEALGPLVADVSGLDGRHVVIADARGEHRLWLRDSTPGRPAAAMIPLDRDFATRIASLLRFHHLLLGRATGPQPRGWPLSAYRQARLQRMLCALDLHMTGATYREIAVVLGDAEAAHLPVTEWKMSSSRSAVIRLVKSGVAMVNGGYRKLLRIR